MANPTAPKLSPARNPKPNNKVWYPDGNIVLATDNQLFRVHKSILSENAFVFRDMLELAVPDCEDVKPLEGCNGAGATGPLADCWEGLPIVRMVGDSNEDVEYFLRAIYSRRFDHII